MRDFIRKRLDGLENRHEKRQEVIAAFASRVLDGMSYRPTLNLTIYALSGVNLIFWLCVLIFPVDVSYAVDRITELSYRMIDAVFAIVFGVGMLLTYSLFRINAPELEVENIPDGLMAGFARQEKIHKRFRVWIVSVAGGTFNLLALIFVEIYMVNGW